nr:site-2 protease family protein [Campylobacterota bacterium]
MGIIIALIIFSFLIFFHELGHFLVARFWGVKVEVFSIGFG